MLIDDERRKFLRLMADTEATVTKQVNAETVSVRLINLSPSGCAFSTETPIEANERLEVSVRSPSERIEPLICSGHVVRVDRDAQHYLVGVEFSDDPS